jgi:hypothetical protein
MTLRVLKLAAAFAVTTLISTAAVADNVSFNYQGRVRVQGTAFTGTGQFKFAIMNTSASATLWSNDGTLGGEPSASVNIAVQDGLFSAEIGSPDLGMEPINSSIFSSRTPLKLRTWFNGGLGFQQLNPDQNLVDLTLNTIVTGTRDFFIYVDGVNGSDDRNGLTTSTAKRTIQAGINAVPRALRCNVTVKVFPGVYRETVDISGITGPGVLMENYVVGNRLTLLGDETWSPGAGGSPNVTVTGCNEDVTSTPVRQFGILCHNNTTLQVKGINVTYTSTSGIRCESGTYLVTNCRTNHCGFGGLLLTTGAFVTADGVVSSYCTHGFYCVFSYMWLYNCIAENNIYSGIFAFGMSRMVVRSGTFRLNPLGCGAQDHGSIAFEGPTTIQGNTIGARADIDSYLAGTATVTFSGNGTDLTTTKGGHLY